GLAEEEAKATDAIGGASPFQQRESERDRLVVAAIGDHRLHLEKARLHIVARARGLGQEELHRLTGLSRDVFEGRQRWPRATGFDEIDRRSGHVALADLGQAEPRLEASLLDRAGAEVYAGEPATPRAHVCSNWYVRTPAAHVASLYPKTFTETFTPF